MVAPYLKIQKISYLNGIIFLSAFLLFQIELIIAKIFLPKFGGSYLVWGGCIVFFQGMLLLGYLYSHLVVRRFGIFGYRYFHLLLVSLPLLFFPGRPLSLIHSEYHFPLVINVFWQLLLSIGPVFFVLSTTSVIFQSWLSTSKLPEHANPYTLYATSNLGAFLALLSYPIFFETYFDINTQLIIWRVAYLFLVGLHLLALILINVTSKEDVMDSKLEPVKTQERLRWFFLSVATTIMFLSVTNVITYEVAPIPLFWVIPLSIYLASFALNFKQHPWCPSWIKEKFHIALGFSVILFFMTQRKILPFAIELICYLSSLFIICMFCNYKLNIYKPNDTRHLTAFYLMVSLGGFLGGMFITWIVPLISTSMVEYLMGLFFVSLALAVGEKRTKIGFYRLRLIIYPLLVLVLWPAVFKEYNIFGLVILFFIFGFVYSELKTKMHALSLNLTMILIAAPLVESIWEAHTYIYKHRNYYGIYKIYEEQKKRFLLNGATLHGAQYLDKKREPEALTYYHLKTPVGALLTSELFDFSRVAVVGLGAGTLAAYNKENQNMDFFELDPDIFTVADKYFTYIKKSQGKVNFTFGDARISLSKVSPKSYDFLVVDAFSGDSVPVHLLTTEAISIYRQSISDKGIVLFHISNRYINLLPICLSNAKFLTTYACESSNTKSPDGDAFASHWVAFTWDSTIFKKLTSQLKWIDFKSKDTFLDMPAWTDQYSNLTPLIFIDSLLSQIKEFQPFYWSSGAEIDIRAKERYYLARAAGFSSKQDFINAITYYKKVIEANPHNELAYVSLGEAYAKLERYKEAIACYNKAIEINPEYAVAHYNLGTVYVSIGERKKALDSFLKAKELLQKEDSVQKSQDIEKFLKKLK